MPRDPAARRATRSRAGRSAERAAVVDVLEDVDEQRRRALVADRAERLHDRFARRGGAAGQRLLEHAGKRCVGADVEDRAHRFALHLRLVVVEQLGQIRQRVAAAELAQQVDGRPADRRVRRALQPLDGAPADGAERRSGSPSAARACAAALRPTAPRRAGGPALRRATRTSPSRARTARRRSSRGASTMWRIIGPATSMSIAVIACCRRAGRSAAPPASRTRTADQLRRRRRSRRPAAGPRAAPTTGVISVAPALVVLLRCGAGRAPASGRARAARWSRRCRARRRCARADRRASARPRRACVRAPDSSRAVVVGDERLVRVRGQQLLGDVVPDRSNPSVLPSGDAATSSLASASRRCRCSRVRDQRLERLREPIGRRVSAAITWRDDEAARSCRRSCG